MIFNGYSQTILACPSLGPKLLSLSITPQRPTKQPKNYRQDAPFSLLLPFPLMLLCFPFLSPQNA